jgi:hypothetical protein
MSEAALEKKRLPMRSGAGFRVPPGSGGRTLTPLVVIDLDFANQLLWSC